MGGGGGGVSFVLFHYLVSCIDLSITVLFQNLQESDCIPLFICQIPDYIGDSNASYKLMCGEKMSLLNQDGTMLTSLQFPGCLLSLFSHTYYCLH